MDYLLEPQKEEKNYLTAAEVELKKRFNKDEADKRRVQSNAADARSSERVDQLVLPDEMRAKMPVTKDKFLIKENPALVQWEREVRKFLRNLSPDHGHRVSAVMVYEWATGINVVELYEKGGSANAHLRNINKILGHYFGKPYMTYICGRKVPKAYRVKPGYYIRRHRPQTLTLYAEYVEGVLYP